MKRLVIAMTAGALLLGACAPRCKERVVDCRLAVATTDELQAVGGGVFSPVCNLRTMGRRGLIVRWVLLSCA